MAITAFVGTVSSANNANLTPSLPTTTLAGDLIVIQVAWRAPTTTSISVPGYTQHLREAAASRTLELWYLVAAGGEANPTVVLTGGVAGNTAAANAIVLRPSEGSLWAWGTPGAVFNAGGVAVQDIGPIDPATGAIPRGCAFFFGMRTSGDATNVPVLSGDGLTWTRTANFFTTVGNDTTFVGSLGTWSGAVPTLTAKTFDFSDGTNATVLGKSALVNEVPRLQAASGFATGIGQRANFTPGGRSLQASPAYGRLVGQRASFTRSYALDGASAYGAGVGQKANLRRNLRIDARPGYGTGIGQRADLTREAAAASLQPLPGYGKGFGQRAGLTHARPIQVGAAYGAMVGQKASLGITRAFQLGTGFASLVGQRADLTLKAPTIDLSPSVRDGGNDLAWFYSSDEGNFGDLSLDDTETPMFSGDLRSDIIVSLGTDARASASDFIPGGSTNRRGWWGDIAPANALTTDEFGSLFWLLSREKQIPSVLVRVREYARRALQWIVDDGIADRIDVDATYPRMGWVELQVFIYRPPAPPVRYRFNLAWAAQANAGST